MYFQSQAYNPSAMTSLVPQSRSPTAERVPLNILPPTIPRNQEEISKESAIVDSQKSFASLFGSKVC
jgi:hypothetical protein